MTECIIYSQNIRIARTIIRNMVADAGMVASTLARTHRVHELRAVADKVLVGWLREIHAIEVGGIVLEP